MNWSIIAFLLAYVGLSTSFLIQSDLNLRPDLQGCYSIKYGQTTSSSRQDYEPIAHSMETFVALVERLEASRSSRTAEDIIKKLLSSYRIDSLANWGSAAKDRNAMERALFGVNPKASEVFYQDELTEEEKCAIHFVLSHAVNFTATTGSFEEVDDKKNLKHPRESGVVSLQGKWIHAIALDKVLFGILGGLTNRVVDGAEICRALGTANCQVSGVKVYPLFAATLGDLTSTYLELQDTSDREKNLQENGKWNDLSCPNQYILDENIGKSVHLTNAMVRGAIDGVYIGYKISKNLDQYRNIPLSQILRMYYGRTGLMDDPEVNWCNRDRAIQNIPEIKDEILNFYKIFKSTVGSSPSDDAQAKIEGALNDFDKSDSIFRVVKDESDSCSTAETNTDKCTTPFDIFAIMDWQTQEQQKNFQIEVIGNLSTSFDVRPRGSSVGVFRNSRYGATGLEVIANNTEGAACSACFIRYNNRMPTKIGETEVFERLNQTLTSFVEAYDNAQSSEGENNMPGAPAKVILYFNYGSPGKDYKLGEAVWEIEKNFQETTVLAIGSKRDALTQFVQNEETDIFTESSNAAAFMAKLKGRLCKAPAEFQYKDCQRPSQFSASDSSQEAVIGLNKRQYWAMYPKYFLKSYAISMKFKPQDGAKIKVCFTRQYYRLIADNNGQYLDCKESSGDDIVYYVSNPCHRRTLHNCDPFYFTVEGKQASPSFCNSPRCSTPKDILFEFQHEGIACNKASYLSVSMLSIMFAGLLFILQRH